MEGISQEAVTEAVTEAVGKSNREQLDVIADFFDEAKADRMESERAIIDALSHSMNEITNNLNSKAAVPAAPPEAKIFFFFLMSEMNAAMIQKRTKSAIPPHMISLFRDMPIQMAFLLSDGSCQVSHKAYPPRAAVMNQNNPQTIFI